MTVWFLFLWLPPPAIHTIHGCSPRTGNRRTPKREFPPAPPSGIRSHRGSDVIAEKTAVIGNFPQRHPRILTGIKPDLQGAHLPPLNSGRDIDKIAHHPGHPAIQVDDRTSLDKVFQPQRKGACEKFGTGNVLSSLARRQYRIGLFQRGTDGYALRQLISGPGMILRISSADGRVLSSPIARKVYSLPGIKSL